jgi:hypothetical protein
MSDVTRDLKFFGAVVLVMTIGVFAHSCDNPCESRGTHCAGAAEAIRGTDSARAEGELPRMQAVRIPDSATGPIERVKGFRVFQAGDCTVWRFTDSVGVHYLAEGRHSTYSTAGVAISCAVAR